MVVPARAAVVLVRFPFSDLSGSKPSPAVVLANSERRDRVLCQITSNPFGDPDAVTIGPDDFGSGSLRLASFARPGKLFTAHKNLIAGEVGRLNLDAFARVIESVIA